MQWKNKNIDVLTDDELRDGKQRITEMNAVREAKKSDPRWEKRNVPEEVNSVYNDLLNEINTEATKRGLWL